MKTRKDGINYIIADSEYDKYPRVIDKELLDKNLAELKEIFNLLKSKFENLYEKNYDIYRVILDSSWNFDKFDFDEGRSYVINSIITDIKDFQETLLTDDNIKSKEELWTLEDEGYRRDYTFKSRWYKVLNDTEEEEKIEEIFTDIPLRRNRTIFWNIVDHGRSSREIIYEDLPIDNQLLQFIQNTRKIKGEKNF